MPRPSHALTRKARIFNQSDGLSHVVKHIAIPDRIVSRLMWEWALNVWRAAADRADACRGPEVLRRGIVGSTLRR